MKEKVIADDSEPAASSTLIEKWGTVMGNLIKAVAFLCSIYCVNFKTLVEEVTPSFEEDRSKKVYFVLADPPYIGRMDQKVDHAECDVFGLKDMEDTSKVLGDVINPERYRHVFCSDLQFYLRYNVIALEKKKSEAVPERLRRERV